VQYFDFELEVTQGAKGTYTVRVLRSPAGEAMGTMRLPFGSLALENRLQALQIALLRSGGIRRRVDTAEARTVQSFGQELWSSLFSGDVLSRFEASRTEARRVDAGMRIKLRIESPELAALPWEYLFDGNRGDFLTLSASTPVVRYIPVPQTMAPLRVEPPLRILAMVVSPSEHEQPGHEWNADLPVHVRRGKRRHRPTDVPRPVVRRVDRRCSDVVGARRLRPVRAFPRVGTDTA
jgi:hypothetical protein